MLWMIRRTPVFTLSFDLLYKGLEITTGGQRIHDYQMILDKMEKRGMDPEDIKDYLMIFKYGMPPHGGLGIGLERLTMRLLDEQNVREDHPVPKRCYKTGAVKIVVSRGQKLLTPTYHNRKERTMANTSATRRLNM